MATKIKPVAKNLYAWSHNQAALLRERRFAELDLADLIKEVEDLGGALERSVRSRGRIIMTPSLHRHPTDHLPELHARGRATYDVQSTGDLAAVTEPGSWTTSRQ